MSILKLNSKSILVGNTVIAAASQLFNLSERETSEVEVLIVGNCDIIKVKGVHYDWWIESGEFCFLEA